jgi:membrane protein implicated in regulation of membrane protease activity
VDLDFLSGLLLTSVALTIVVYVVWEIVADRVGDLTKVRHSLAELLKSHFRGDAKPVNDHLIGSVGTVISHSDDSTRPMKVRLGLELWPARPRSGEQNRLPVGTPVEVTAFDGPIVVVEATSEGAGRPSAG